MTSSLLTENNFTVKLEKDTWLNPHVLGDNLMLWLDATDPNNFDKGKRWVI